MYFYMHCSTTVCGKKHLNVTISLFLKELRVSGCFNLLSWHNFLAYRPFSLFAPKDSQNYIIIWLSKSSDFEGI